MLYSRAMIKVGCAGFAIPQTRYFQEFYLLEVQDSQHGPLGTGTIRRWHREAPEGFEFTLLAPREIAAEGFRDTRAVRSAVGRVETMAKQLDAKVVVFLSPPDFVPSRARAKTLRTFFSRFARTGLLAAWEPPVEWSVRDVRAVCDDIPLMPAYDGLGPLGRELAELQQVYLRLPGPAGRRSRYEESALLKLSRACRGRSLAYCVFTNVDMHTDAKRLMGYLDTRGEDAIA